VDRFLADVVEAQMERALARQPVPIFTPETIVQLRRTAKLSQPAFARALGISVWTLRNWEQGKRRPRGPGRALLARGPR
jgi:DNA-binding transcriptional regulator YiaG